MDRSKKARSSQVRCPPNIKDNIQTRVSSPKPVPKWEIIYKESVYIGENQQQATGSATRQILRIRAFRAPPRGFRFPRKPVPLREEGGGGGEGGRERLDKRRADKRGQGEGSTARPATIFTLDTQI